MNARTAISFLRFGTALLIGGGSFKVRHWPSASIQLIPGTVLRSTALAVLAINAVRYPDHKGFPGN